MIDELPAGNFTVVAPPIGGMYFQQVERFPASGKLYGDITKTAERIMRTFLDRPRATGALFVGEKGSGKSQLARVISELGYDSGIPTILVNEPHFGDGFNKLLGAVEQPAIVIFDEFEKTYRDQEHQEAILTLLDGVMTTQKLFIFTANNQWKINDHMKNRPGRMLYWIEFSGVDTDFIREYCDDNLENMDELDGVLTLSAMFKAFNFDMLKALVEEMNRYNENAFEAVKLLNTKPHNLAGEETYEVWATAASGAVSEKIEHNEIPLVGGTSSRGAGDSTSFYIKFDGAPDDVADSDDSLASWERELLGADGARNAHVDSDGNVWIVVEASGLKKIDVDAGRYQFIATNGLTIDFKRKDKPSPSYHPMSF